MDFNLIDVLTDFETEYIGSALKNKIAVKKYVLEGGKNTTAPWKTSGFYAKETSGNRIVLEAFLSGQENLCVVRVYEEQPLAILFAKKVAGSRSTLAALMRRASEAFAERVASKDPEKFDNADETAEFDLNDEQKSLLAAVLNPIPPPISLGEIESA